MEFRRAFLQEVWHSSVNQECSIFIIVSIDFYDFGVNFDWILGSIGAEYPSTGSLGARKFQTGIGKVNNLSISRGGRGSNPPERDLTQKLRKIISYMLEVTVQDCCPKSQPALQISQRRCSSATLPYDNGDVWVYISTYACI